jgi:hypothetical protein
MTLRVTVPPSSGGLITLDDLKGQLRVDFDDDNTLLTGIILAASNLVQSMCQRYYLPQTLEWVCEGWEDRMTLPVATGGGSPNLKINSVKYSDLTSTTQTLDPSLYWDRPMGETRALVRRWYSVYPLLGDGQERVVINFSVLSTAYVPEPVKHAVRMLASHFYRNPDAVVGVENRDSSTPIPFGVEALVSPERWERQP